MPGGRPSKYDPALCADALELMRAGFSKTAVAGALGIARSTLHEWCDQHAEFSDAIKEGEAARTFKLESDLLGAKDGPTVTSRIFALKNAAPDEWRDRREVDNTHNLSDPLTDLLSAVASDGKRVTDAD